MSNASKDNGSGVNTAAVVLALIAGLWMLLMGVLMIGWNAQISHGWMWGQGMMHGTHLGLWWPWFGIIAGTLVLFGAAMLRSKPEQMRTWGTLILVISILNIFFGMGGIVAGLLGTGAGIMALSEA